MKSVLKWMLIFSFVILCACTRVTQANFDKIHSGMSKQNVIALLGEPTASQSISIGGISGTSATWKSHDSIIEIQFLNDTVQVKTFSRTQDKNE